MNFTHDFADDLQQVLQAVRQMQPVALARYGDGEWAIVVKSHEDERRFVPHAIWRSTERWDSARVSDALRQDLVAGLRETDEHWHVGIICPGCKKHCSQELHARSIVPTAQRTYAEVFMGSNWPTFVDSAIAEGACLVGCAKRCEIKVPADAINQVGHDVIADAVDAMAEVRDRPILVAAGPAANVMILRYFRRVPPQQRVPCIDVGSALDPMLHGERSRYYQDPRHWRSRLTCSWDGATVRAARKAHRAAQAARMR